MKTTGIELIKAYEHIEFIRHNAEKIMKTCSDQAFSLGSGIQWRDMGSAPRSGGVDQPIIGILSENRIVRMFWNARMKSWCLWREPYNQKIEPNGWVPFGDLDGTPATLVNSPASPSSIDDSAPMHKKLRMLRTKSGKSVKEVAALIDTHPSNLSSIESGKNINPKMNLIVGLARIYGVSIDYLLGGEEDAE